MKYKSKFSLPVGKRLRWFSGCLLAIIIPILIIVGIIINNTLSIPNIPKGELLLSSSSPHNSYTIEIYRMNGGATTSYAIRGELIDHNNRKRKKVYYEYKSGNAEIKWIDENNVTINGRELDLRVDVYDSRKDNSSRE